MDKVQCIDCKTIFEVEKVVCPVSVTCPVCGRKFTVTPDMVIK